ncbi:10047_t:CDS:10 [Acaulospora morrowiae]|uniref:10047_t:CDS:1 n=1 Tax=Acaulospora morrowiae TaxID=94023 RepID=A0A9N8Z4N3_9GLOM|nr:10047_t:CDS:10 [Acaulospora morrowiae]
MATPEHPINISFPEERLDTPLPPSVKLQKAHEEHELLVQNEVTTEIEHPTVRNTAPSYDTDFPSLSSTTASSKSSVWGSRSGAELIRNSGSASAGSTSDNRKQNTEPFTALHSNPAIKKPSIITERLELPASQQLQKREFGNKTTTADIVKRIKDKTNVHIDVSTAQRTGTTTYLIKGKLEDVMRAKRELLDNLAVKIEAIIQVPVSARLVLLGYRGQTLQAITMKTGTRIQLPPRQENSVEEKLESDYDEEEEMMSVKIEGDVKGVSAAKAEIEAIVNDREIRRRITHIERCYFPLIMGARNRQIQRIISETGVKIHFPPYIAIHENGDGHERDSIVVNGEREAVKKAIELIEEIYMDLKSNTRTITVDIPKFQQKYLAGTKGAYLHEILETTGCSLELSPLSDPSDKVTIRGLQNQLMVALQAVMEKAGSIHVEVLDIAHVHKSDQEHVKNVLKYLVNRGKLKKIETDYNIQIISPKGPSLEKGAVLEFVCKVPADAENSNKVNVENARREVTEIIKNLPPGNFAVATIEPHLHRHVIGRKGQNLQRVKETYGVEIIVPDEKDESPDILIVYEGKHEEIPADKKKKEHIKEVLEKAKNELIKAGQDASDFATQTLNIPVKFHRHIIGPRGATLNSITGGIDAPVSVKFGSSRTGAAERSAHAEGKKLDLVLMSNDVVVIKGPTEEVERVVKEINRVVEEAKHHEIMNSYTVEFTFPAQYSAHIIGKGGAQVTKLKENYNVRIDIEGGKNEEKKTTPGESVKVTIMGKKADVEDAKARILDHVDKLQDATVLRIKIPPEHHKSLIGAKGRYVKRLEEKYGVHIHFPKSKDQTEEGELDDDAQKADEVIIKGGKRGANDAKTELLDLLDYEKEHSNSETFTIPAQYLPHIVGRNGSRIIEIKDATFTRIDLGRPESQGEDATNQVVNVSVQGTKGDIVKAKNMILDIVNEFEKQITIIMNIDPQHHRYLIGPGGNRIREIVAKACGTEDKSNQAGIVKFPRPGNSSDEVILKGERDIVEKVKAELERLVEEQSRLKVEIIKIPRSQHPAIIGRGGNQLREIQNRFNVEIRFPASRSYHDTLPASNIGEEVEDDDAVKIIGKPEDIEAAKEEIMSKIQCEHAISVPLKFFKMLSPEGTVSRKLWNEFHVQLECNEMPKENLSKNDYGWHFEKNFDEDDNGEIKFVLKGERSQVGLAEKYLNDFFENEIKFTHTGYMTIPQQYYRHIIGRHGTTIARIRNESGCRIEVPKKNEGDVVFVGSLEGIENARKQMVEVVERAEK